VYARSDAALKLELLNTVVEPSGKVRVISTHDRIAQSSLMKCTITVRYKSVDVDVHVSVVMDADLHTFSSVVSDDFSASYSSPMRDAARDVVLRRDKGHQARKLMCSTSFIGMYACTTKLVNARVMSCVKPVAGPLRRHA